MLNRHSNVFLFELGFARVIYCVMAKSLSERIGARAKPQKRSRRNRAVFLALRTEIEQAIADGWSKKAVWETLREEGAIQFGYDAFLAHARKSLPKVAAAASRVASQPRATTTNSPQGFTYSANPNKEELF
jgi:hypothetical protein